MRKSHYLAVDRRIVNHAHTADAIRVGENRLTLVDIRCPRRVPFVIKAFQVLISSFVLDLAFRHMPHVDISIVAPGGVNVAVGPPGCGPEVAARR